MEVYAEGALRQERVCPDCKGRDFVEDHAAGDIVCRVSASSRGRGWGRGTQWLVCVCCGARKPRLPSHHT